MYQIGVDLGGTTIKAGIVNDDGKILLEKYTDTNATRDNVEIMGSVRDLINSLLDELNIDKKDIKRVGIGTPGTIDFENGIVMSAFNLGFENFKMRDILSEMVELPVFVENDANCAAYGEFYVGAAKECKSACMLTIGTGLGGGLILEGKAVSGSYNSGGEIGHMVLSVGGRPCTCGRQGCFEAYCSATALIKQSRIMANDNHESLLYKLVDGNIDNITPITLFQAKDAGDREATKVFDEFCLYLAEGITNIINMVEPEKIVIGGGVSKQGENLLKYVRPLVEERCFGKKCKTEIVTAELLNQAGIIGASFLGRN